MKTYKGQLKLDSYGESDDVLFISTIDTPLVEALGWISGKKAIVRYCVTEKQTTKEESEDQFLKKLMGVAEVEFHAKYSEITGYLWTDEELNIGGHDIIAELKSYIGEWLILEIET